MELARQAAKTQLERALRLKGRTGFDQASLEYHSKVKAFELKRGQAHAALKYALDQTHSAYNLDTVSVNATLKTGILKGEQADVELSPALDEQHLTVLGPDGARVPVDMPLDGNPEDLAYTFPSGSRVFRITAFQRAIDAAGKSGDPGPLALTIQHETIHFNDLVLGIRDTKAGREMRAYRKARDIAQDIGVPKGSVAYQSTDLGYKEAKTAVTKEEIRAARIGLQERFLIPGLEHYAVREDHRREHDNWFKRQQNIWKAELAREMQVLGNATKILKERHQRDSDARNEREEKLALQKMLQGRSVEIDALKALHAFIHGACADPSRAEMLYVDTDFPGFWQRLPRRLDAEERKPRGRCAEVFLDRLARARNRNYPDVVYNHEVQMMLLDARAFIDPRLAQPTVIEVERPRVRPIQRAPVQVQPIQRQRPIIRRQNPTPPPPPVINEPRQDPEPEPSGPRYDPRIKSFGEIMSGIGL